MPESLLPLQNGSDVRGVAIAKDKDSTVTLTCEATAKIAAAFVPMLSAKTGKAASALRIGVGHDSRVSAERLKAAVAGGLKSQGAQVLDCGLASTPAMFMGTVFPETAFDGSIMITASHLPFDRNGMKFFTRAGGFDKKDITELLLRAQELPAAERAGGVPCDLMPLYAGFLRQKIVDGAGRGETPLAGLHIVVDAGNGAGGFFVKSVLAPLGANCSGSQFLEPDGMFPNHEPNPESKQAMAAICAAVIESRADLGVIFDTDVDRMSAVFAGGREAGRNSIIALMAAILAPEYPGATIVTDSVTSDRLTGFLESLGLRHHCFQRGYKNVINEALRLNAEGVLTPLAIETSGHGALKENYFLDDGAYMAVRITIAAAKAKAEGRDLASLIAGFVPAEYERELRFPINAENFAEYGRDVLAAFARLAADRGIALIPSFEGVRLSFGETGWALLRMSLHDPLMPLNAESGTGQGLDEILSTCKALLSGFDRLDLSPLLF